MRYDARRPLVSSRLPSGGRRGFGCRRELPEALQPARSGSIEPLMVPAQAPAAQTAVIAGRKSAAGWQSTGSSPQLQYRPPAKFHPPNPIKGVDFGGDDRGWSGGVDCRSTGSSASAWRGSVLPRRVEQLRRPATWSVEAVIVEGPHAPESGDVDIKATARTSGLLSVCVLMRQQHRRRELPKADR